MKKNFQHLGGCLLFSLLGCIACTSKQERAQKTVEKYMIDNFENQWFPESYEFEDVTMEKYYNGAIYDQECLLLARKCIASIIETDSDEFLWRTKWRFPIED